MLEFPKEHMSDEDLATAAITLHKISKGIGITSKEYHPLMAVLKICAPGHIDTVF